MNKTEVKELKELIKVKFNRKINELNVQNRKNYEALNLDRTNEALEALDITKEYTVYLEKSALVEAAVKEKDAANEILKKKLNIIDTYRSSPGTQINAKIEELNQAYLEQTPEGLKIAELRQQQQEVYEEMLLSDSSNEIRAIWAKVIGLLV